MAPKFGTSGLRGLVTELTPDLVARCFRPVPEPDEPPEGWTPLDEDALGPLRKAAPGLYARLVTERNERWIAELKTRMDGSGSTVVVVGVGHLVGEDGLPARLRALGYSVEGP